MDTTMSKITADVMPLYAVSEEDAKKFIEWIWSVRDKTQFDYDTLTYPRSCMTRAQNEEEIVMLIPLQPVLMFESMARKPGTTDREAVLALLSIDQKVQDIMKDTGHREAYFITNDKGFADISEKNGWIKSLYDPEKNTYLMKRKVAAPTQPEVN